jgi:rRNA methylases
MITSLNNETIKELMKLKQKKYRDERQLFLIEGYHLVEEARKHKCLKMIVTTLQEQFDEETLYVSSNVMNKLSFTKTPQPIMGVCQKQNHNAIVKEGKRYLLLDRVQDPGNVGTMIRTALAFGYDQIIMSLDCVDLYNDKVIRSTQGALFQMNICMMDLSLAIEKLHLQDVKVYGTALYKAKDINVFEKQEKMAFIAGNEGQGIDKDILEQCDECIYIPIQSIESLNVAIASSIVMYHFH